MASLSNSCKFSRSLCKLLNGSSSSFTAACWFDWLMLDFLKQLTMVSFDTGFHDDTKCFIAGRILIFASSLLLFTALIQRRTTFFRWCALSYRITPWSIGWRTDVALGGRKIRLMFVRSLISGWVGQSSIRSATFLLWARKDGLSFLTHSSNKTPVIQLFFYTLYRQGSCFTFLKHHGFSDLPITNISNFSQVALAAAMPVNLTLLLLPPEHFSPDRW